jgi:hypothetical protein
MAAAPVRRRDVRASDMVITMGCGDSTVREIRDRIHDRVKTLVTSLPTSLLTKETTLP